MPGFWKWFYLRQAAWLAASAVVLLLVFNLTRLDLRLADAWYDPSQGAWPMRRAWWAAVLVHRWMKLALILAAFTCIVMAWRRRASANASGGRLVAASSVLVPLAVSMGKRTSAMHCPWEVDRYGGLNPYFDLLTTAPANLATVGHCFPAAFVTSASWLLAFALFDYPARPRESWRAGLLALALSLAFGWVQQMRGAHFLSHTLWSIWLSWTIVVGLHAILGLWRQPLPESVRSPQVASRTEEPTLRSAA